MFIFFNLYRNLALVILAVYVGSVISQDIIVECNFYVDWNQTYVCILREITVLDPSQNVTFGGTHVEGLTNDDVTFVEILYSDTPFIIPQMFTTFPHINVLRISYSNLQSINIPDSVQLLELWVDRNNISRIESRTFENQESLRYLNVRDSKIQEIDEDAFIGLSALESLVLMDNHIATLAPRTFHPLINVTYLDLNRNNLTSISDELFSQNTQIVNLYLDFNQIEEISPRFTTGFGETLRYIDLEGNNCVDRRFEIDNKDDFSRIILHNSLRTCFNNFQGTIPDLKRITLEFEGPMKLYDEFGNIVASL